jgi:ATP-dependent protease ClpP protease subunit
MSAVGLTIQSSLSSIDPLTLKLEGEITQLRASEFESLMSQDIKIDEIILNSGGGDEIAAIHIGNIIRQKKINVRVSGRCLSACFQYIFLQANRKTISPESIVALHSNSKSANEWIRISDVNLKEKKIISYYYENSYKIESTINLYIKDNNILQAMEIGFKSINPICFALSRKNDSQVAGIFFQYSAAIPTLEMLKNLGVVVEGAWPANTYEILKYHGAKFINPKSVTIINNTTYVFKRAKEC